MPACGVATDPWTPTYSATYTSTDQGEAAPSNYNPGLKVGYVPFTLGSDPNECGVAGRAVVVHAADGKRIGCGIHILERDGVTSRFGHAWQLRAKQGTELVGLED